MPTLLVARPPDDAKRSARSASWPPAAMHPATGSSGPDDRPELGWPAHHRDRRRAAATRRRCASGSRASTWKGSWARRPAGPGPQAPSDGGRARRHHRPGEVVPPGKLTRQPDGSLAARDEGQPAHWTLDTLTAAAHARGIAVARSQVRRILLREGVSWRQTHSWAESEDPDFVPKGRKSSGFTRPPRPGQLCSASTSWGR